MSEYSNAWIDMRHDNIRRSADPGVVRPVVMVVYMATVITRPGSTTAATFPTSSLYIGGSVRLVRAELIPATAQHGRL